jgi:hypothetical protein
MFIEMIGLLTDTSITRMAPFKSASDLFLIAVCQERHAAADQDALGIPGTKPFQGLILRIDYSTG